MSWALLVSIAAVVSITAVYFTWVRKPEQKQEAPPQQ
jgi:hypothetical protein